MSSKYPSFTKLCLLPKLIIVQLFNELITDPVDTRNDSVWQLAGRFEKKT